MKFTEKLLRASQANQSWLCIGLDPDLSLMPPVKILDFNRAIIEATSDLVCAYKPNFAFYEALGIEGLICLEKTIKLIPDTIAIIGDAKRGDIGNTAKAYAKAIFQSFGCDAATVNPYLGTDGVEPFLEYKDKGVFILCRTSNPGANDFQNLICTSGFTLYEMVARKAQEWNTHGNVGLVAGATYPEELKQIRRLCPRLPLLIPGVGAQGGDLALAVKNGADDRGEMAIINVSRQILYASRSSDFAKKSRRIAADIRDRINAAL